MIIDMGTSIDQVDDVTRLAIVVASSDRLELEIFAKTGKINSPWLCEWWNYQSISITNFKNYLWKLIKEYKPDSNPHASAMKFIESTMEEEEVLERAEQTGQSVDFKRQSMVKRCIAPEESFNAWIKVANMIYKSMHQETNIITGVS